MPIVIILVLVPIIIAIIVFSAIAAKKRREELGALAFRLGLSFSPEKDHSIDDQYRFLNALSRGSNRYAYNIISGNYMGHQVKVFDYHYQTQSTNSKGQSQTHHHNFSFFALGLEILFPELTITKEGLFSKIGQALGFDDIDFESHEFSRLFCVRSKDKKFAYDVCNAKMIEYLLENKDMNIEIERNVMALAFRCLDAAQIEYNLARLIKLRTLIPQYLFSN